jgi:ATP-dependent RNA helicase DeaD
VTNKMASPRERGMLRAIERATRQPIEPMNLPTIDDVNTHRINKFKQQITDALAKSDLGIYRSLIEQYESEHDVPAVEIAAALARISQGETPLLLEAPSRPERGEWERRAEARGDRPVRDTRERSESPRTLRHEPSVRPERIERSESRPVRERGPELTAPPAARVSRERLDESVSALPEAATRVVERAPRAPVERSKRGADGTEPGMERFRIEVGHEHNVQPGNIVGAIANEADLDSKHIGRIEIFDDFTLVDLPEGMPDDLMQHLQNVWVAGQRLRISRATEADLSAVPVPRKPTFGDKARTGFKPGFRSDKPKRPRF